MGPFFCAALRCNPAVVWVVNWPVQKSGRIGLADDINSDALDDIGLHKGIGDILARAVPPVGRGDRAYQPPAGIKAIAGLWACVSGVNLKHPQSAAFLVAAGHERCFSEEVFVAADKPVESSLIGVKLGDQI